MDKLWKGLVVGAITGAAIGLVVDLLGRARDGAVHVGELAREHGPDVAAALAGAATAGAERLREADLPDKLRQAAHTAATSDAAKTIRAAADNALDTAKATAKDVVAKTGDIAGSTTP